MPNGGSDCCGTCWFNSANAGEPGYPKRRPLEEVCCTIRGLAIQDPFWTYCANHPHHNPERIAVPIGPVYVTDSYPYTRRVMAQSPDTEAVRAGLLNLLEHMEEAPRAEYPTPTQLDEEVIRQLMEFREPRAAPALRRIIRFDPLAAPSGDNPFGRNRVATVALAVEALAAIEADRALGEVAAALHCGLPEGTVASGTPEALLVRMQERWLCGQANRADLPDDPLAAIRYHAVLGLRHCRSDRAKALLREAMDDPHPEVAAFAREVLAKMETGT